MSKPTDQLSKIITFTKKIPTIAPTKQSSLEDSDLFGLMLDIPPPIQESSPLVFGPQRISESTGLEDLFSGISVKGPTVVDYYMARLYNFELYGRLSVARCVLLVGVGTRLLGLGLMYAMGVGVSRMMGVFSRR
jgi:hypothetical protein